jgi:hypothetical protein
MLASMQIEHEVDERSRQACSRPAQQRKPRAGELHRPLEIDDPERWPQIPMRLQTEIELARLAVPPHLDVVGFAVAHGHARVGQVRQDQQRLVALIFDLSSWC